MQDRAFSPAANAFASEPEACEDAPLPAVIEALVLRRVLAQYACTSRACLGCASLWNGITPETWPLCASATAAIHTHCCSRCLRLLGIVCFEHSMSVWQGARPWHHAALA